MIRLRPLLKNSISWIVLVIGFLVGFLILIRIGSIPFPLANLSPDWYLRWFSFVGLGIAGLVYTAGSMAALHNRRFAGQIFLALLPIVAFCFAYPQSTIPIPGKENWVQWATPNIAIGLSILFYLPFATLFVFKRNKPWFAILFVVAIFVAVFVFWRSEWTWGLIPKLLACSAVCGIPAAFWLGTHKLGWPQLLKTRDRSFRQRLGVVLLKSMVLLTLLAIATITLTIWFSRPENSYKGKAPFTKPISRYHAVFIARTVLTGRKGPSSGRWSNWAIASIDKTFWAPCWTPRWVLVTNWYFENKQTYFVDGEHEHGLLTRFLPIISAGASRTRPLSDASVDLRILREPSPSIGTRIIGFVSRPVELGKPRLPFEGVQVSATSAEGVHSTATDKDGIYEFKGLPQGDYEFKLTIPDKNLADLIQVSGPREKIHVGNKDVVEVPFYLHWDGGLRVMSATTKELP